MYQLKFWQADNTFMEVDMHQQYIHLTAQQREASTKTWYRKLWTFWLPKGIRIQIVRLK